MNLLDLPPEVLEMIMRHLFKCRGPMFVSTGFFPRSCSLHMIPEDRLIHDGISIAPLLACRKLNAVGTNILYKKNHFVMDEIDIEERQQLLNCWLNEIGPENAAKLAYLRIEFPLVKIIKIEGQVQIVLHDDGEQVMQNLEQRCTGLQKLIFFLKHDKAYHWASLAWGKGIEIARATSHRMLCDLGERLRLHGLFDILTIILGIGEHDDDMIRVIEERFGKTGADPRPGAWE